MPQGIPNPQPAQGIGPSQSSGPMEMIQRMIFNKLYNGYPQFRQFADSMQRKTPEQAFQECGLDYNQYRNVDPNQIINRFGL